MATGIEATRRDARAFGVGDLGATLRRHGRPIAGPQKGAGPPGIALAFAASVAIALLGALTHTDTLRLAGGYGAVVFGVGAAPLQLLPRLDLWARLGLAALIGASAFFGLAALMADVRPLWHPTVAAALLGGGAAVPHLLALRRRPPRLPARPHLRAPHPSRLLLDPGPRAAMLAGTGTALWLGVALTSGHLDPGVGGLLRTIDPAWYVGVALVLASIAFGGRDERLLAGAVLSLALATTLTPALVYAAPRTQSAAKHIDLVNYVLRTGHIVPSAGIYQAYSAFFSGNALLSRIVGSSNVFGLAAFWPVVLAPLRVAELRFLSSRMIRSRRGGWIVVTLVVLVDSLGADYFSPQALGYVLALGIFGLAIRGVTPMPLNRRASAAVLILASLTLAVTHELSPFIAAGVLLVLAFLGLAAYRIAVAVALPAVVWAGLEHRVLSGSLDFSHLFSPSNFAPPKTDATAGLQRMSVVGLASDALLLGLVLLIFAALFGFWRHRRSRWAWACLICPGVGLSFIAFNSYGNEGIFRATLFAIPWLAILAVRGVTSTGTRRPMPVRQAGRRQRLLRSSLAHPAALLAAFLVLLGTFVIGAFSMDGSGVLRRTDMTAMRIFLARAPADSFMVPLGYGDDPAADPSFSVAAQARGRFAISLQWQLVAPAALRSDRIPDPASLRRFDAAYRRIAIEYRGRPTSGLYLLWSKPLMLYSEEYGEQSGAQSRAWLALLRSSPHWRTVYRSGGTYLFRLRTDLASPSTHATHRHRTAQHHAHTLGLYKLFPLKGKLARSSAKRDRAPGARSGS